MARKKTRKNTITRRTAKRKTSKTFKNKSKKSTYIALLLLAVLVAYLIYNPVTELGKNLEGEGKAIAFINNEPIYEEELVKEASRLPPQMQQALEPKTVLTQLIDKKLLLSEAKKAGTEADEEINKILNENNITLEQLEENIAAQGFTLEEFKDQLRVFVYLDSTQFSDLEVNEEEATAYYNENIAKFTVPETVRARHILVSFNNRTDEEALVMMNEIKKTFEDDNTKFCDLVNEHSEDPGSKENCGEYPAFSMDSNFVQEFKDAAFDNEVEEARVAKTQFGYHLIQTLEKTPGKTFTLEEVKEQLINNLLFEKQKEKFRVYIEELRSKSDIINCLVTPEAERCKQEKEETTEEEEERDAEENLAGEGESQIEKFAKCLTEKGLKMYGAYWCSQCKEQKEMFAEAVQYINYVECAMEENQREQTPICQSEGISGYPTWEINGKKYPGKQTLEALSKLSDCEL